MREKKKPKDRKGNLLIQKSLKTKGGTSGGPPTPTDRLRNGLPPTLKDLTKRESLAVTKRVRGNEIVSSSPLLGNNLRTLRTTRSLLPRHA